MWNFYSQEPYIGSYCGHLCGGTYVFQCERLQLLLMLPTKLQGSAGDLIFDTRLVHTYVALLTARWEMLLVDAEIPVINSTKLCDGTLCD